MALITTEALRYTRLMTAAIVIAVVVLALAAATIVARRKGYGIGGDTVVRCRAGHLFTTLWIPGVSLKSVRLGLSRFQYCPVGKHWTLVTPVRESELTDQERQFASQHHDGRVP